MIIKKKWITVLMLAATFAVRADLQLSGVMLSKDRPAVLVNGSMLRIGEAVDGFTVVEIEQQGARFRNAADGEEFFLSIGESFASSPKAAIDLGREQVVQHFSGILENMETNGISTSLSPEISLPPAASRAFWAAMILATALNLFMVIAWWKVCSKAGQPGWSVFIPVYNLYVMLKVADKPWWWLLLMLIPGVNIVVSILLPVGIARAFGKGIGFALGLIFLPVIFYPVLAFGSAPYLGGDSFL